VLLYYIKNQVGVHFLRLVAKPHHVTTHHAKTHHAMSRHCLVAVCWPTRCDVQKVIWFGLALHKMTCLRMHFKYQGNFDIFSNICDMGIFLSIQIAASGCQTRLPELASSKMATTHKTATILWTTLHIT